MVEPDEPGHSAAFRALVGRCKVLFTCQTARQVAPPASYLAHDGGGCQAGRNRRRQPHRAAFRFEVPTPLAANPVRNFKSKSGTRIIELLVPLCFRSSCQSVLRCITNFGNGALEQSEF